MQKVLFACVHNAGRSQMAAALFNRDEDRTKATAVSAGTEPTSRVHAEVLEAMKEVDIDLSSATPQFLSDELAASVNILVTMGCGEACPVVPGVTRLDWPLEDPKGKPVERVRAIRNENRARIQALLADKGWLRAPSAIIELVRASADHEAAIKSLLSEAGLPLDGLEVAFPEGYVVARTTDRIVGCAGVEVYGTDGLLRSLAVAASEQKSGLGSRLVANRLDAARANGLAWMFAITTTAADFFERVGFERIGREMVSPGVRGSAEFASICPSTAAVLRKSLQS
jgi:protein-tyrosine-phosphatase/N-acetylglutamate synthase-like GNAT family acetyltransferase